MTNTVGSDETKHPIEEKVISGISESATTLSDFPKVHCPFVRQTFKVDRDAYKKHGSRLMLKKPEAYLVIDKVNDGYEWVFDDPDTIAVEKLDGTNVKLRTEGGRIMQVQNRKNIIDPLQVIKGKLFLMEGIFQAMTQGLINADGEQAGEIIGPKLQSNPYKLDNHLWYPFDTAIERLAYTSFHDHERTLENWSAWFKDHLASRFYTKRARKLGLTGKVMAEGVIFYNLRRKSEHKTWMAKLRRDMFPWFYEPDIPIVNYTSDPS